MASRWEAQELRHSIQVHALILKWGLRLRSFLSNLERAPTLGKKISPKQYSTDQKAEAAAKVRFKWFLSAMVGTWCLASESEPLLMGRGRIL